MNEPPSNELVRQLTELQLCRPGDLRQARRHVRRLATGLPAFDSVWIDSLVQLRRLTPFQARKLERGQADQLRLGQFVAVDELGRSQEGATYLARRMNHRDRCVIKQIKIDAARKDELCRQMNVVFERANGFAHPNIAIPADLIPSPSNELLIVNRFVPGLPLNELLIRRGRFPAAVVLEIGRQLLDGLSALHARTLVHGDIRLSNVRLTDHGLVVLVDSVTRAVIHPEITIHDFIPLETRDGLAPELIGTGQPVTATSELYALGCLLWQLLAGRPPHTTADPLAKLAAHQTQRIADVRTWAPDTPAMLAEAIQQMTSPIPNERPRSCAELLQKWRRPTSAGRSRLRQFRALFDSDVPHLAGRVGSDATSGRLWMAAAAIALVGSVAVFYEHGLRNELLEIVHSMKSLRPLTSAASTSASPLKKSDAVTAVSDGRLLPLPTISADGVIVLKSRGPYAAGKLSFPGDLVIRGMPGIKPEIQIDGESFQVTAQSITLERISVRNKQNDNSPIMIVARAQRLVVANCEFVGHDNQEHAVGAIAWSPTDPNSLLGSIEVKNTHFHEIGAAILLSQTPRSLSMENILKTGSGALTTFGPKSSVAETNLAFHRVTLREAGPLVQISGPRSVRSGASPIQIEAQDCVFQLADATHGLITIDAESPRRDLDKSIYMQAVESVVVPGTILLATYDPIRDSANEITADESFTGLAMNEVQFAGNQPGRVDDCRTMRLGGPRVATAQLPGIEPAHVGPTK